MADRELLERLTLVNGVSGHEKLATRVMKEYLADCADDFQYDNLGGLVAVKRGTGGPKVLLAGHIDEIGFYVRAIDDKGFIKVQPVGSWSGINLPSSLVVIITRDGREIPAVFGGGRKSKYVPDEKQSVPTPADCYLDIGVKDKDEALAAGIRVGDPVAPVSEFTQMANPKYLMSKAFDDRVGVAIVCQVLKNLKGQQTQATIYGGATVQEEQGARGARTMGHMVQPDVAFALDVCFSHDTPDEEAGDVKLGCGAVLSVMDSSVIAHTGLLKRMEQICREQEVPYQLDILPGGGTDSSEFHKINAGVINMTLSIPSRYMHSHRTVVHEDDIDATIKILTEFCRSITWEGLEEIRKDKQ